MKILEFDAVKDKEYWLEQIKQSDWRVGQYLYQLLRDGQLKELCGAATKVLLLTEGERLISFCTLAEQDDIREPELSPWIGFVYTFPEHRGKRRMGKLLEYAYAAAKKKGAEHIYISTNATGLYEKYGYTFYRIMKDIHNEDSRVYRINIEEKDYSDIIGTTVSGLIDRPFGIRHPKHSEMIYPVNYGYVKNVFAGDGAEQDVYVMGTKEPLQEYAGTVIAVWHRLNDVEDKWIVSLDGRHYSDQEILDAISFQEQYFVGELYR